MSGQQPVQPPSAGGSYAGQPATSPAGHAPAAGTTTTSSGGAMSNQNLNQIVSTCVEHQKKQCFFSSFSFPIHTQCSILSQHCAFPLLFASYTHSHHSTYYFAVYLLHCKASFECATMNMIPMAQHGKAQTSEPHVNTPHSVTVLNATAR